MIKMRLLESVHIGLSSLNDLVAGLADRLRASKAEPLAEPSVPARLTEEAQWICLEDVVHDDIARSHSVIDMQQSAERHLDAAHYALDRIAVELIDVMPSIAAIASIAPQRVVPFQAYRTASDPTPAPAATIAA